MAEVCAIPYAEMFKKRSVGVDGPTVVLEDSGRCGLSIRKENRR